MIRILVDSTADFELCELKHMDFVPLTVSLNETDYLDTIDLNKNKLYELLSETEEFPKTSQPSPAVFAEIFEDVKAHGDELLCFSVSSGLSGTYQSAVLAKNMVDYDKIYLIDTLNVTAGIRLMAEHAMQLRDQGLTGAEIAEKINMIKSKFKLMAGVDTLEYLCRGGRLNRTAAAIGELANLKPVVTLSEEGTVEVIGKCLGRIKAANFLLKQFIDKKPDPSFPVYTLYSYGTENLEKLESKLISEGYTIKGRQQIGATIGAHVGPGAFGIAFVEQ